jgi:PKHD-type hydroxylase
MFTIPDIHSALEPCVCWSGAFSEEELDAIIELGDAQEFHQGKTGSGDGIDDIAVRNSNISWIQPAEDTAWLFNKMVEVVARMNTDKYQFDLTSIDEFQYTTYTTGGFYSWHIDGMAEDTFGPRHRKLGIILVLSDPTTEFAGGEFQIIPDGNPEHVNTIEIKKGDVLAFPAFVPHQVAEVTSGKRRSLVCWVLGPKFK